MKTYTKTKTKLNNFKNLPLIRFLSKAIKTNIFINKTFINTNTLLLRYYIYNIYIINNNLFYLLTNLYHLRYQTHLLYINIIFK